MDSDSTTLSSPIYCGKVKIHNIINKKIEDKDKNIESLNKTIKLKEEYIAKIVKKEEASAQLKLNTKNIQDIN